ncbi:hypothetical protein [Solitalea canadensis]|uniref:Lipoprotein n=1 Tax=Solitalea canadensis (strain ATCC 29591 / DSM 3403 / JCM 21819 / LMG 8368 / NBRC 15130 / NCIMB 12057 / USAM 9D) TaxID=929556 RepID=H8KV24_SOLCM|nr:hypothetical protein [Solitalea canadensis]AFD06024.1 hypothetical protein Solca_0909 [Solitalea canadensis DSM 3403]
MKKTLLLMGVLVSFLSCQKDADKACPYLNTSEKHVNDLGVPIQTCGEELMAPVSKLVRIYDGNKYIDESFDEKWGYVKIYMDEDYLYIQPDNNVGIIYDNHYFVGPESKLLIDPFTFTPPTPYWYHDPGNGVKVPLSKFKNNEVVAISVRYYIVSMNDYNTSHYYTFSGFNTKVCRMEPDAYGREGSYEHRYFLYKIVKCCNPAE